MPSISPRAIADTVAAIGGPAPLLYGAAAVTIVGNGLSSVVSVGPVTGYQFVQAGGKCMDKAMSTLCDKKTGDVIHPVIRSNSLALCETLRKTRIDLENDTKTIIGSARNWAKGRDYYKAAFEFESDVTLLSEESVLRAARERAAKEIAELSEAAQSAERRHTVTTPAQNLTIEPEPSDVRLMYGHGQEIRRSGRYQEAYAGRQMLANAAGGSPAVYPPHAVYSPV